MTSRGTSEGRLSDPGLAQSLWDRLPRFVRNGSKGVWGAYAQLTNRRRLLPDVIIIGTQRSGTTSLYKYLVQHPAIGHAITKELRFFDLNYHRGVAWYRSRFPSARYADRIRRTRGLDLICIESSPDYMFHPHAPRRAAETVPDTKLIVMLRNPVDRAYSHYWHQAARGFESLSFQEAIDREPERLAGELAKMLADERYVSFERHHHSYLARGVYVDQLMAWMEGFPRDRFLIQDSEEFFSGPSTVFKRVLDFLEVPDFDVPRYEKFNAFGSGQMDAETRSRLVEYFRPYNQRLFRYLGRHFDWDR